MQLVSLLFIALLGLVVGYLFMEAHADDPMWQREHLRKKMYLRSLFIWPTEIVYLVRGRTLKGILALLAWSLLGLAATFCIVPHESFGTIIILFGAGSIVWLLVTLFIGGVIHTFSSLTKK